MDRISATVDCSSNPRFLLANADLFLLVNFPPTSYPSSGALGESLVFLRLEFDPFLGDFVRLRPEPLSDELIFPIRLSWWMLSRSCDGSELFPSGDSYNAPIRVGNRNVERVRDSVAN